MGSFTPTAPSTAKTATRSAAKPASGHADQIQGAPAPSAATPAASAYTHADRIQGAAPSAPGIMPGEHDETIFRIDTFPDPLNSPWLNPGGGAPGHAPGHAPFNALDPFGGAGADTPATAGAPAPQLPPPPPLPPRPGTPPASAGGLDRRTPAAPGQTPVYTPNEAEGGGNSAESAAYVQRKNADAAKIAKTEQTLDARRADAREKQRRAEQKAGERARRWHAEEMAEAQKDMTRRREQLAKTVATKVRQLMEPADHPGLSDDAEIVREARRQPLSAEAAASNDRQVQALGNIGGVGDLPVYTADAAENYGDKGMGEVADLIHRTAATDPAKGKTLLDQTSARMSEAKARQLKQTVASFQLNDGPEIAGQQGRDTLSGGSGEDNGGDWDEGLSPYERNQRMFPGSDDDDKPNTYEHLKRQVTDTDTSVKRDVPPYKAADTPPTTDKGKTNFYVHHLDLDPKLTERIKPDDIETLRLLERFRQLDGEGTKALEKRLGDLRERDPQLHK